jgi:hypothetical protein
LPQAAPTSSFPSTLANNDKQYKATASSIAHGSLDISEQLAEFGSSSGQCTAAS